MLFKLGQIVSTPGALSVCEKHSISPLSLITRHCRGDFGDLDVSDVKANVTAIQHDLRVLSMYKVGGVKLYCITEASREYTTLLRADEY